MPLKIEAAAFLAVCEDHGWNAYQVAKHLEMDHSAVAKRIKRLRPQHQFPALPSVTPAGTRFVVTCAVSGSQAHSGFLATLRKYCKDTGAQLLVVPLRYRNPTSSMEQPDEWFDPDLVKDFCHGRHVLAKHLFLMADVPTQPTAARPLSGLATMTGADSAIYPHPKVALESVPTGIGQHAKLIMTTGAITEPEYSISKAGKKGEFHHVCGALVVEAEGSKFHCRHINADHDGSFCDLQRHWTPKGGKRIRAEVLTLGDVHATRVDRDALSASMDMIRKLKPEYVVLHDVLDFESASHHNTFLDSFRLHQAGRADVEQEIRKTGAVLRTLARAANDSKIVVVQSNHHDHLTKWLNDKNAAHDATNALIYHWLKTAMLAAAARGEHVNPFEMAIREFCPDLSAIQFLKPGTSLCVSGVEYGYHGHQGPNGSRGSIGAFTRVAVKTTVGHSHTPGIMDGVYQVGTTSLMDLGYNVGAPSSWLHSNCVQYAGGKRALLNIIGGEWRQKA